MENKFIFENTNTFTYLLILPTDIDNLDWNSSTYLDDITNLNIYQNLNINTETFIDIVSENLLISNYENIKNLEINSQVICECPNYIYELLYVNDLTENDNKFNSIGSLLNNNGNKLYGNVILTKTYVPTLSDSMLIQDCYISDIRFILNYRFKTNIVKFDSDEWSNDIVIGNIDDYAKQFFEDQYIKFELPFLMHNINIYYEISPIDNDFTRNICGKIINKPIYKCIWFTMINDEYRGSIFLDEVQKIIKLSNFLDAPYSPKEEWLQKGVDIYNRPIIKNKYKILDLAYNQLIN
jgi:hypothetical protein